MNILNKERSDSILTMRNLISDFLKGTIGFIKFYDGLNFELGSSFDPFDWAIKGLEESLIKELKLYMKFSGGDFGEDESFIPKNSDWVYGESTEKFGWIDTEKYKKLLQDELSKLELKKLDQL